MSAGALTLSDAEERVAARINLEDTKGLVVSDAAGGLAFANATQLMDFAKMMAVSSAGIRKHLRGNPGACLAICTQAVEWGMSPFAVANKSYFVNDQIAFESQLVQAVILKRAPIRGRIKFEFAGVGEKRICRAWARLSDEPDEIVEYVSPEFGRITPKNSPLWKADPDQQHAYYSGRALCRRHFPDVLLGVYADDEINATPRGPEQARNITPAPRKLADKLDALAKGPAAVAVEKEDARSQGGVDEAKASETSDVTDSAADTGAADEGQDEAGGGEEANERELLLTDGRSAAMDGGRALKSWLGKLTHDQYGLLTSADEKSLKDAARAVDEERAA